MNPKWNSICDKMLIARLNRDCNARDIRKYWPNDELAFPRNCDEFKNALAEMFINPQLIPNETEHEMRHILNRERGRLRGIVMDMRER
jgi:hypothetical protein